MPPSRWLVIRFIASRPKPSPVTSCLKVRRKSCGVARSTPSFLQICAHGAVEAVTAPPRSPRTRSRGAVAHLGHNRLHRRRQPHAMRLRRSWCPASQRRHRLAGHLPPPSMMCSRRMWATSPGRWPVSRIIFRASGERPASSNAAQNCGISLSDRTRSRLLVALRSTRLQGLPATVLFLHRPGEDRRRRRPESGWRAIGRLDGAIIAFMSARAIVEACSLPQRGSDVAANQRVGLPPGLVALLGVSSTYCSANSAKVPAPRSAFCSAAGSLPLATCSMASAARCGRRPDQWRRRCRDGANAAGHGGCRSNFQALRAGRLHAKREPALMGVPDHEGAVLGPDLADVEFGERLATS